MYVHWFWITTRFVFTNCQTYRFYTSELAIKMCFGCGKPILHSFYFIKPCLLLRELKAEQGKWERGKLGYNGTNALVCSPLGERLINPLFPAAFRTLNASNRLRNCCSAGKANRKSLFWSCYTLWGNSKMACFDKLEKVEYPRKCRAYQKSISKP